MDYLIVINMEERGIRYEKIKLGLFPGGEEVSDK
jgi:hypothetical protein